MSFCKKSKKLAKFISVCILPNDGLYVCYLRRPSSRSINITIRLKRLKPINRCLMRERKLRLSLFNVFFKWWVTLVYTNPVSTNPQYLWPEAGYQYWFSILFYSKILQKQMFNESHIYIDHIKIKMIPELTIKETFFLINYLYLEAKYQSLCVLSPSWCSKVMRAATWWQQTSSTLIPINQK